MIDRLAVEGGWAMLRVPLRFQIGAVIALLVAALATLWTTSASVVARDRRRVSAGDVLTKAGSDLARGCEPVLASAPGWLETLGRDEWEDLDRRLVELSGRALARYDGVEGGYFLRDSRRFLGTAYPTEPDPKPSRSRHAEHGPPPREVHLIEIQADAAIRLDREFFAVVDVPPSTVAIRTAPVRVNGRPAAAIWTMTRLVDPLFLDRSLRGYRLSAGLALGGVVLALILTLGLSRTVARQRAERDRLQVELRRSERLAALGKLLAGVAHEVRNPLAGIRSTVQLWQRGIGPDAESFGDLLAEVDRLDGIVARLLHFTRADAQEMAPGDLNALAAEAARLAGGMAEAREIRVETALAPGLPTVPMAAPAVMQVLRNLTANAIQSMPSGGIMRVSTGLDPSRRRVEVEVADTGPGLAPEVLAHLFEPFFTTRPGGTGLGLAIAREIALAHRGDLRAGARPGGPGAAFTLSLPIADPLRKDDDARRP